MNKHLTDIQLRFSDTDMMGHINNVSYATFAETARLEFFNDLKINLTQMILANLSIDFRYQAKFDQPMVVETGILSVGNSSINLYQKMFSGQELAAEVSSVGVYFDYEKNQSIPVTDAMRRVLESYLVELKE